MSLQQQESMSRLLFHSSKRSAEKRPVMMDVHVVYTALMVFGCIVFRRVVCAEEDDPDIYFSCKDGFYRWKNKCYTFLMDRTWNWDKAQRVCTDNYMRVVEPTTSPYNEHIKATGKKVFEIARGNKFFIGLRKESGTNWRWESNNRPPTYTDWGAFERIVNDGVCVIISFEFEPVTWIETLCSVFEYVICEYETEKNECASNPCRNKGVCGDQTNSFVCTCATGYTGSSCEFKKPGELYHNCPEDVYVDQGLLCDCKILDPGEPAANVGWRDWRKPGSKAVIRTLEIPIVNKSDEGKTFTCQYTWNANGNFTKHVNYTLRLARTGIARVKSLQLNSSDADIFTDKTNELYELDCLAIGNPKPDLDVFLVTGATGSGSPAKEVKQVQYRDLSKVPNYRQKLYTVRSPAVCQTYHTFRCYTNNSNGNHSKTITITAGCSSSIEPAAFDMTLIASVLASSSVLCALLAATILFVRRWKNKRAMREMAEAESRRRSAMDLYDAGLTEPETSATPAGETASPLPPDTSANLEPEGNSPSNSSTDSSIDSAEFNR